MGAKPSSVNGSATLSADSNSRSRTLSTSAGHVFASDGPSETGLGLLRSASQGGSSAVVGAGSGAGSTGGVGALLSRDRVGDRGRTRSLSSVPGVSNGAAVAALSIPTLLSRTVNGNAGSETEGSSPEDQGIENPLAALGLNRVFATHSLPAHLWSFNGFKCPVCSKLILADDLECHLVICLTKPRINYNEDVLYEDKGECVICFEDLSQGDTIARLPCLCIYHKACIDQWFQVNRSCPGHPYD